MANKQTHCLLLKVRKWKWLHTSIHVWRHEVYFNLKSLWMWLLTFLILWSLLILKVTNRYESMIMNNKRYSEIGALTSITFDQQRKWIITTIKSKTYCLLAILFDLTEPNWKLQKLKLKTFWNTFSFFKKILKISCYNVLFMLNSHWFSAPGDNHAQ